MSTTLGPLSRQDGVLWTIMQPQSCAWRTFRLKRPVHFDVDPKMSEPGRLICDQLLSQTREP
jgi:hypothetical protein